jgi:hypothetical protein
MLLSPLLLRRLFLRLLLLRRRKNTWHICMRVRVKHVGICVFVRESYLLRIRRDGGRERLEKETIEEREREKERETERERKREREK